MIIFTCNILAGQAVQTQIRHCGVWHLIRVSTDRFQTALSNLKKKKKKKISPNCTQIENGLIQLIKMEKSILHKLINMIQLFYGAKMMHQYLTSIVFCLYFLFHLFKRNIQNILFFFFFFLKCSKNLFFSNVQYYCKHHLFGSARSIILFFLYKQLPKPFKGPLYHPCREFIITSL